MAVAADFSRRIPAKLLILIKLDRFGIAESLAPSPTPLFL